MEFKKHIHHDTDIEKAIVGIIILEREAITLVGDILEPEMFYHATLSEFYKYLLEMHKKGLPIDLLTATNYIVNKIGSDKLKSGQTIGYVLLKCTQDVVNSANVVAWANIIRGLYVRREWVKIKATSSDDIEAMLEAQDKIKNLTTKANEMGFMHLDDALIDLARHIAQVEAGEVKGIPTGCKMLDLLNGGYTCQFIVLAARPSVGKSAFMGKAALEAAEAGYNVGLISLEMPRQQIAARLGSIVSGLDFWRIYRAKLGEDKEREINHQKLMKLAGRSIYIADKVAVTLNDIRAAAFRMKRAGKLDILYIDYLQLIDTTTGVINSNREREVAQLSRGLKILSLELGIPIIALAQLNRDIEKGPPRYPKLSDLRESGSLEQDADAVIFLHRDYKAGKPVDEDGFSTENFADIVVPKWRNGEDTNGTGPIKMGFIGALMQFTDELPVKIRALGISAPPPAIKPQYQAPQPTGARLFIETPKQGTLELPAGGNWKKIDSTTGEIIEDEDDRPF
jgi:replicative DNA helicase